MTTSAAAKARSLRRSEIPGNFAAGMSIEDVGRWWFIRIAALRGPIHLTTLRAAAPRFPLALAIAALTLLGSSAAQGADSTPSPEGELDRSATWSTSSPIGPIEYRAGRGLSLGDTGLNIGGFSTLEIDVPKGESDTLELDSINFLVLLEPNEYLRGFMELEVGDLFGYDFDTNETESNPTAVFERLYGDFTLNDAFNLRGGKFQTPIGRWNLVPAEPFVWTAIEPTILTAFPETQTGGATYGSFFPGQGVLDYWVYGQFTDSFDIDPDDEPGLRSVGGRVEFTRARLDWSVGASFLATGFEGDWNYLGGLDGVLRWGPLELTSEFVYQDGDLEDSTMWDIYLQGVLEIFPTFHLVARYEHFSPLGPDPSVEIGDFGVAWLPKPFLIFKATYRITDGEPPEDPEGFKIGRAHV